MDWLKNNHLRIVSRVPSVYDVKFVRTQPPQLRIAPRKASGTGHAISQETLVLQGHMLLQPDAYSLRWVTRVSHATVGMICLCELYTNSQGDAAEGKGMFAHNSTFDMTRLVDNSVLFTVDRPVTLLLRLKIRVRAGVVEVNRLCVDLARKRTLARTPLVIRWPMHELACLLREQKRWLGDVRQHDYLLRLDELRQRLEHIVGEWARLFKKPLGELQRTVRIPLLWTSTSPCQPASDKCRHIRRARGYEVGGVGGGAAEDGDSRHLPAATRIVRGVNAFATCRTSLVCELTNHVQRSMTSSPMPKAAADTDWWLRVHEAGDHIHPPTHIHHRFLIWCLPVLQLKVVVDRRLASRVYAATDGKSVQTVVRLTLAVPSRTAASKAMWLGHNLTNNLPYVNLWALDARRLEIIDVEDAYALLSHVGAPFGEEQGWQHTRDALQYPRIRPSDG